MRKLLWACAFFLASFALLSLEYQGSPLFTHLHRLTQPLFKSASKESQALISRGLSSTQKAGDRLFQTHLQQKKDDFIKNVKAPAEEIPEAHKKELNDLVKKYSQ